MDHIIITRTFFNPFTTGERHTIVGNLTLPLLYHFYETKMYRILPYFSHLLLPLKVISPTFPPFLPLTPLPLCPFVFPAPFPLVKDCNICPEWF